MGGEVAGGMINVLGSAAQDTATLLGDTAAETEKVLQTKKGEKNSVYDDLI
jgi:hypothetical protein